MLETLNDYLSFFTLIILFLFALRLVIGSLFEFRSSYSRRYTLELLARYRDNEDEQDLLNCPAIISYAGFFNYE